MGKNDFLTPKAIANRVKSKGLQKLRWYCQMCQKQCRDENGFKCHLTSESHKRQMMVFGENPDRVIDGYSEEFLDSFMEHLRRAHPSARVSAKVVYNEYIADKHHVHMNSTKWLTLTDFVKFLGREGYCKVDQTEKGWHLVYIKKDIEEELEEERKAKRQKAEKADGERQQQFLQAQIERAMQSADPDEGPAQATELLRDENGGAAVPLQMALGKSRLSNSSSLPPRAPMTSRSTFAQQDTDDRGTGIHRPGKPMSKQEQIMKAELERKQRLAKHEASEKASQAKANSRKDAPWLQPNIIVKVTSKELKEHGYYREKGVVVRLVSAYVAEIEMQKSGDILQVDQAQLETVLPSPGGTVLILRGPHTGEKGTLKSIDVDKFQAQVALRDGTEKWMEYEDMSKFNTG